MAGAADAETADFRVVAVFGSTAVGKTEFAVRLALAVGGEVVSADSVQVYRGLDVGSAKPTPAEMRGVPHHLIDVLDPFAGAMDAKAFGEHAKKAFAAIHGRGRVPILVGGTALYLKAALGEWLFPGPPPSPEARRAMFGRSTEELYEELRRRDPDAARRLSPRDRPRIVRALEGRRPGDESRPSPYRVLKLLLWRPRQELYARIDARARRQWEGGLLEEARSLLALPEHHPAARALGYREARWYWMGLVTWAEGLRLFARNTRHFAKRQETWWRREQVDLAVRAGSPEEDEAIERVRRWLGRA